MKSLFAMMLMLVSVVAFGQANPVDHETEMKYRPGATYTADMCSRVAPVQVNPAYVLFCIKNAPHATPACPKPETVPFSAPKGLAKVMGQYFEPLDCSWHLGHDPRQVATPPKVGHD